MRDGEPQIYTALATMRNGYMQSQWSRVQMFLGFNTLAFPFVFGSQQAAAIKFAVSGAAVAVHVILLLGTIRADRWVKQIDSKLRAIEELDTNSETGTRVRFFADPMFRSIRQSPFASRRFFGVMGGAALVVWIFETLSYLRGIM